MTVELAIPGLLQSFLVRIEGTPDTMTIGRESLPVQYPGISYSRTPLLNQSAPWGHQNDATDFI